MLLYWMIWYCHNLSQCWNIVDSNLRNRLQWNLKWNSDIFIRENAFENVVCEMTAVSSRPQYVDRYHWHRTCIGYSVRTSIAIEWDYCRMKLGQWTFCPTWPRLQIMAQKVTLRFKSNFRHKVAIIPAALSCWLKFSTLWSHWCFFTFVTYVITYVR